MKTYFVILFYLVCGTVWSQTPQKVDSLLQLADKLYKKSQFKESREQASFALERARRAPQYYKGQADAHNRIGLTLKGEGRFEAAYESCMEALKIRRFILKDSIAVARSMANITTLKLEMEEPEAALRAARQADAIFVGQGTVQADSLRAMLYINMANVLEELDSLDAAIAINKKSLAIFPVTRDTFTKVLGEYGLAKRLLEKKDFAEARLRLDTALLFNRLRLDPDSLRLGQTFEMLGVIEMRSSSSNPLKVIEYLEQARDILVHFPQAKDALANLYFNLGEAYESNDDFEKAGKAYLEAKELCTEESQAPELQELIESRIEGNENRHGKVQYSWWLTLALISLAISLLIALVLLYFNSKKEKARLVASERLLIKEQEVLIRKSENDELKQQMFQLRHDLVKNFLQNIDLLITANDPEKTTDTFQKIKFLTSTVLAQVGYANMTKDPEKLKDFAQNMHLQAEISAMMPVLDTTYYDDLPDFPISKLMRENLVAIVAEAFTNIRKYAFDNTTPNKTASIRFEYNYEQGLILTIEDKGKGFDPDTAGKSGLNNLENRAKTINGMLVIKSEAGKGTTLQLVVPGFPDDTQ